MSNFLETSRLIITPPHLNDFANLYALQSDPEVMQFIGNGVRGEEEVMKGLTNAINHYEKYGFSFGCVFEKGSGKFVGRAGLIYLGYDDTQPDIEIAYALVKSAWNKGYATELATALTEWGFQNLNVNRLVADIKSNNQGSRHVLEKIGMKYEKRIIYPNTTIEVDLYCLVKNK